VLSEIKGVKHIYSVSRPGMAVVTVQFKVGEDRTAAIVRLSSKIRSNEDWLPPNLGVGQPIIKPKGIDDVPILTATLWSGRSEVGAYELGKVAHAIEQEIKRVPGHPRRLHRRRRRAGGARGARPPGAGRPRHRLGDLRRALQASNSIRDDIGVVATTPRCWCRPAPS
jgi:hypothetical protein